MINRIQVKDVATYDEKGVTIENISKINYIYGANGCGKTTISNFLYDPNAEKFSECKVEWENNIEEKIFVYNKEFRDSNFRESDIAGIFTLGQATGDEIEEIKQKKIDLANVKKNIVASNKTIEGLQGKIEEENNSFKEILWKDVYKVNELKIKAALVGFLKKDSFATKLEGTIISKTTKQDRNEVESRANEILGEQPVKKKRIEKINTNQLLEIEKNSIWNKCIVGKTDIPIAKLIKQFGNSDWVNQGRMYITVGTKCPFCQKETIDDDFKAQLESFFDKEFEDDVKEITANKQDYICEKTKLLNKIDVLLSENKQDLEGASIDQIRDALEKCLITNEKCMEEKIKEPGKKVPILSTEKYISDINKISNILFVVSSLLKDVIFQVLEGTSNIKQIFVLTHNVYFHKELSFIGNGNNSNKFIHYWILKKKNQITNVQYYGMENPISSSYELLWKELKEVNVNSNITIQNVMRRIIENYFKILGKYKDDELINKFLDYESQEICRSLLSWINDGSHCMPDDLYVESVDDSFERYQEVFKKIFDYTNHIEHYNMMMGIKEDVE